MADIEKIVYEYLKVARAFDDYGREFPGRLPEKDQVHKFLEAAVWTFIDRGNLMRIAHAAEANLKATRALAAEVKKLNQELREMTGFWRDLRAEYRRNRGEEG